MNDNTPQTNAREGAPVFVLGMHRSGTSAFAGALHTLGVSFGSQLVPPRPGVNERGFFEDERVVALHEDLLAYLGRSWRHPLPLPEGWLAQPGLEPFEERAELLLTEFRRGGRWGLKDPRLCLLFPFWRRLLKRHGLAPKVLIALRHPAEVAASLGRRDGLGEGLSCFLWSLYCLYAELSSRGLERRLVGFDALLENPSAELGALEAWLALLCDEAQRGEARTFLERSLSHHRPAPLPDDSLVARLYGTLSDSDLDTPACQTALDGLRGELTQALVPVGAMVRDQADQIAQWEAGFAQASEQLEASGSALDGFQQAVERVRQRDAEIIELKARLAALEAADRSAQAREAARSPRQASRRALPAAKQDHRYHGVIDLKAENNSHTRVARYVNEFGAPDRGPVLEVGCAGGYFGDVLRKQGYEVWGVEANPAAVVEASERLEKVYRGTIEDFLEDPAFAELKFQFVIFGDVLEHLVDPETVLKDCRRLLDEDGALIASVPNVAHRSVRLMLLEGRWEYDNVGIMDASHLHFYTRDTLLDLFSAAGYAVQRLSPITLKTSAAGIKVNPALELLFEEHIDDADKEAFQFVSLITPAGSPEEAEQANRVFRARRHHKVLCVPPLASSSLYSIRLADPIQRWTELFGGELRAAETYQVTPEDLTWADTVVFQRESNEHILGLMRQARALGKRVVFDIDDLLIDVPEYLSVAEHARQVRPWLEQALGEADAVSVSTSELREQLLPYNQGIFVTPNYAYTGEHPIDHYDSDRPVRILIASSDSVRVDFLVGSLREVTDGQIGVELVGIGPPGEFLRAQGLPIAVLPNMPHSQFKSFLVERDNTMALIPLDDNRFNRCKSPIKFFDYALAGVPCICSAVATYQEVIDSPLNGMLCADDEAEWTRTIRELVRDPIRRGDIAERARERCLKHHNLNLTAAAWDHMLRHTPAPAAVLGAARSQRLGKGLQLARGTLRHLVKPASYRSVWRIYREEGIRGVKARWRTVF